MKPKKIMTIVGARPQFIKAAIVSKALSSIGQAELLVHTGQHYDKNMSEVFFNELDIPFPKIHLGIGSGLHGAQTGAMMQKLEQAMQAENPDWVLVYGDTNSTLAGALVAAKLHIPVAHVEAGLRSYNRVMPEEINRVVTDHISSVLFAPTAQAVACLAREGIRGTQVLQVGDVMYDVALQFGALAAQRSDILDRCGLSPKGYVLATIHRAENTDDPLRLRAIIEGLGAVAREWPVLLPMHPRTLNMLRSTAGIDLQPGIRVIDPVGYLDMVALERGAALVATDSGGVQKEAFFHGVPCVTLRTETEWTELVELGWNRLQPPDSAEAVARAILSGIGSTGMSGTPYGEGNASEHIARFLAEA